jgi:hypothetical protein
LLYSRASPHISKLSSYSPVPDTHLKALILEFITPENMTVGLHKFISEVKKMKTSVYDQIRKRLQKDPRLKGLSKQCHYADNLTEVRNIIITNWPGPGSPLYALR